MSKMIIKCVVGQPKENYDGEFAPVVLAAITEWNYDDYPNWFDGEFEKAKKDEMYVEVKVVHIEVDQDELRKLLLMKPEMKGKIKGAQI